jgi:glycosyltransferase involved in cell wall biosynthesis
VKTLSAIAPLRNVLDGSTPVWESLMSMAYLADEVYVIDCNSDDGTREVISTFCKIKGDRIRLIESEEGSFTQDTYDEVLSLVSSEWVIAFNPDEIFHENSSHFLRDVINRHHEDFDSITCRFVHYDMLSDFLEDFTDIRCFRMDIAKSLSIVGDRNMFGGEFGNPTPSGLMPEPIHKFRWNIPEFKEGIVDGPRNKVVGVPEVAKRIANRKRYSFPVLEAIVNDPRRIMMEKGISVCFVIKNGVKQGYPFWESLESCLPYANEIVVSDGHSDDGTLEYIQKFSALHPGLVKIYHDDWSKIPSGHGEVISVISNRNLRRCSYEWIHYLQADEIIHPDNHSHILNIATNESDKFNSVSFPFWHFIGSWRPVEGGSAYKEAIRMVKNKTSISLIGDAWNFGGAITPVCPAGLSPKPIYHLAWVFPYNCNYKRIEHGKLYSDIPEYQKAAAEGQAGIIGEEVVTGVEVSDDFDDFPDGIRRLVGKPRYEFREDVVI